MKHRFRSTTTYSGASKLSVVTEQGGQVVIQGVSTFQAGVELLGHGKIGDAKTLDSIIKLGNARPGGIKSRLGHPGMSESATAKQVAQMRNFRLSDDGTKALADAYMLNSARISPRFNHDVVEYLSAMALEAPGDIAHSIVVWADAVWKDDEGAEHSIYDKHGRVARRPDWAMNELPIIRPVELGASDFVDEPAANRDGLFSSLGREYDTKLASDMFAEIDEFLASRNVSTKKAYQFCERYFAHRLQDNGSRQRRPQLDYEKHLNDLI